MSELFDLSAFEDTTVGDRHIDNYGEEDPAYITPPITSKKNVSAIALTEPTESPDKPESERKPEKVSDAGVSSNSLRFDEGLRPLAGMLTASTTMEFSDHLDQFQANVIELCYELNLLIVNEGFETPELAVLKQDLSDALVHHFGTFFSAVGDRPNGATEPDIEETKNTGSAVGDRPKDTKTIHGGYIEEKKIPDKRGNPRIYLYERWREDGKLKSRYIGRKKAG